MRRNLDGYEARRRKGIKFFEQGWRPSEVAGLVGVSRQAVSQWLQAWRRGGQAALARVRHKGRPPRLNPAQRRRLSALLRQGAAAHGWSNDLWSGRLVARLIEENFGVLLHPKHVPRLLRTLGWTRQRLGARAARKQRGT